MSLFPRWICIAATLLLNLAIALAWLASQWYTFVAISRYFSLAMLTGIVMIGSGHQGATGIYARAERHSHPFHPFKIAWPMIFTEHGKRSLMIPLWIPFALCVACTAWLVYRRRMPKPVGQCPDCGYELRGNVSGTCSECGWTIPESIRKSLHTKGTPGNPGQPPIKPNPNSRTPPP